MNKIKLFCLPCAGGAASMFNEPMQSIDTEYIDVIPIEYNGRGELFCEPYAQTMQELVSSTEQQVKNHLHGKDDYALLGYSMGSIVALELYYALEKSFGYRPKHIFFAAHNSPLGIDEEGLSLMDDSSLLSTLKQIGGIDDEILSNQELVELFIERMRSDIGVYSKYQLVHKRPIQTDISIIYSSYDNRNNRIKEWSLITRKNCNYHLMDGNHFFINTRSKEFCEIINGCLMSDVNRYMTKTYPVG